MRRLFAILVLFFSLGVVLPLRAQADPELAREAAALGTESPALKALLAREAANPSSRDLVLETLRGAKELKSQGLPPEPYLLKANEGLAKGLPPEKILPAMQESRRRTETAAGLVDSASAKETGLSPQARQKAILEMQGALLNGVSPHDLEKALRNGQPNSTNLEQKVEATSRAFSPRRHVLIASPPMPKLEPTLHERSDKPEHHEFHPEAMDTNEAWGHRGKEKGKKETRGGFEGAQDHGRGQGFHHGQGRGKKD